MITELIVLYGIFGILVIISLLLLSVLKGIADTLEQKKEIYSKQLEWMNDIYDVIYTPDNQKSKLIIGDEEPNNQHQLMFEEGIKKLNEIKEKKSTKQED